MHFHGLLACRVTRSLRRLSAFGVFCARYEVVYDSREPEFPRGFAAQLCLTLGRSMRGCGVLSYQTLGDSPCVKFHAPEQRVRRLRFAFKLADSREAKIVQSPPSLDTLILAYSASDASHCAFDLCLIGTWITSLVQSQIPEGRGIWRAFGQNSGALHAKSRKGMFAPASQWGKNG